MCCMALIVECHTDNWIIEDLNLLQDFKNQIEYSKQSKLKAKAKLSKMPDPSIRFLKKISHYLTTSGQQYSTCLRVSYVDFNTYFRA